MDILSIYNNIFITWPLPGKEINCTSFDLDTVALLLDIYFLFFFYLSFVSYFLVFLPTNLWLDANLCQEYTMLPIWCDNYAYIR
jgi:hypothetical protein